MDYRPSVPDEITMLCFIASGRDITSTFNKMFRGANKYPSLCFFPWRVSLSRTLLAMIDWLSYRWLMTRLQSPRIEFKLVIMLIHDVIASEQKPLPDLPTDVIRENNTVPKHA